MVNGQNHRVVEPRPRTGPQPVGARTGRHAGRSAGLVVALTLGVLGSSIGTAGAAGVPALRSAASLPKACAQFTPDVATAALGGPVNPPVPTHPSPKITLCKYTRADGSAFGDVEVGPWEFVQIPGTSQKIKGIGDEAEGTDPFGVSVRKGSNGFNVSLSLTVGEFSGQAATDQSTANIAAATAIAKQLNANLSRMPRRAHG
jgi:hypothetical protein